MEELLRFIMKRSKFLMFIALELVAFMFIVNGNDLQKSSFLRHTATISAGMYGITTTINDYFHLINTNETLAIENSRLRNELEILQMRERHIIEDSLSNIMLQSNVHYKSAKVVYSSIYKLQNYIIIDKGSDDGILPDMGVIESNNVVGVIQYTTKHYSVVLPLINTTQRISGKIKRDNQLGTITWDGTNSREVNFDEIPRHALPEIGDTIVTSGYSAIFPEGYLIGTITEAECSSSNAYYDIHVALSTNFSTITYVSVVIYDTKSEMQNILKEIEHEK